MKDGSFFLQFEVFRVVERVFVSHPRPGILPLHLLIHAKQMGCLDDTRFCTCYNIWTMSQRNVTIYAVLFALSPVIIMVIAAILGVDGFVMFPLYLIITVPLAFAAWTVAMVRSVVERKKGKAPATGVAGYVPSNALGLKAAVVALLVFATIFVFFLGL